MTTIFLSSNFAEFKQLRALIADQLPRQVEFSGVEVTNLDDNLGRTGKVLDESLDRVRESDFVILLLGKEYGGRPGPDEPSYTYSEYKTAFCAGVPVVVFAVSGSGGPTDMGRFLSEVHSKHTISTISNFDHADDLETVRKSVAAELQSKLGVTAAAQVVASSKVGIGERIQTTTSLRWHNETIGSLDKLILGTPQARGGVDETGLVSQTGDEWNEACKAWQVLSLDLMIHHLERGIDLRPLDAESRIWLARLALVRAEKDEAFLVVADHAEAAAEIFTSVDDPVLKRSSSGLAGMAWLLRAKALRRLIDHTDPKRTYASAHSAARSAVERLDFHSESHLELFYTSLLVDDPASAAAALSTAFYRFPLSLRAAEDQLIYFDAGPPVFRTVETTLLRETRSDLKNMVFLGAEITQTVVDAWAEMINTSLWGTPPPPREEDAISATGATVVTAAPENQDVNDQATQTDQIDGSEVVTFSAQARFEAALATLGNDPVATAHACQSTAVTNLRALRALEQILQRRTTGLLHAERDVDDAETKVRPIQPLANWSLGVIVFAALGTHLSRGQTYLTLGVLMAGVIGLCFILYRRRATDRARISDAMDEFNRQHEVLQRSADRFEQLVDGYERHHLGRRIYSPATSRQAEKYRGVTFRLCRSSPATPIGNDDALAPRIRRAVEQRPYKAPVLPPTEVISPIDDPEKPKFGLYGIGQLSIARGSLVGRRWRPYSNGWHQSDDPITNVLFNFED